MQPELLIQQVAAGSQQAFRALYDMYSTRVYNTCLVYLQNAEEAEEATQDVFIEVHNAAPRFMGKSSVTTWIYRIAVNKSLDRIRYRKRQKRFAYISALFHADTGQPVHDPGHFEHPGVLAENKEKAAKLFAAMSRLPENQQTAFILKQVEGLTQKEIAAIMNLGEKAVESLIQRAKANLRKLLAGFLNDNEGN